MPKHLLAVSVLALALQPMLGASHSKETPPSPTFRVPVQPLGYRPPGSFYLLSGRVFSTLDFVDSRHLLFTFHQPRLMRREPHPAKNDADQVIQAVVLELPEGRVEASTEWRMHDRGRYLWPLGGGRFLVRQGNSFSLTDASLALHPYLEVTTPVESTDISPDGRILAIEHEYERHTDDQHRKLSEQADRFGDQDSAGQPPGHRPRHCRQ